MTNDKKPESVDTGSSDDLIKAGPSANDAATGQPDTTASGKSKVEINMDDYIPKDQYKKLEKKLGEQGMELGNVKNFLNDISPLLDKLQEKPDLAEAIVEGKFDDKTVEAILEGNVTVDDATTVKKAHDDVKKDLGKKQYSSTSPEEIEKLVSTKIDEKLKENAKDVDIKITKADERRRFEKSVEQFVAETDDFAEYADDINKWFEEHTDQFDIEVAYHAVKGRKASSEAAKKKEEDDAEAAKQVAQNAAGGYSQGAVITNDKEVVDELIGSSSNPNTM